MADSSLVAPHSLSIYIKYDRLTVRSVADLISGLAGIAEMAIDMYCGITGGRPAQLPTLEIESAHTGDSIKLTFGEGWLPSVSTNTDDDIVIGIPKKLGIPLLVGYLMLSAAERALNVRAAHLDSRLKQIELQLKEIELHEKLSKVHGASDALRSKSASVANTVISNKDYTSFVLYGVDILNIGSSPDSQYVRKEED